MACRFCHCTPGLTESTPLCYAVSLFFKDAKALIDALRNIERTGFVIPGISVRCEKCQLNSVVSYCMYVYKYTETAQLHSDPCVDATEYYNRMLSQYALLYPLQSKVHLHLHDQNEKDMDIKSEVNDHDEKDMDIKGEVNDHDEKDMDIKVEVNDALFTVSYDKV
jgi:hypothetical protein